MVGSAGSTFIAPVTSAKLSSGAMATLGGGPTTLAGAGNSATMRGAVPERSMIETVSGSGSLRTFGDAVVHDHLAVIGGDGEFGVAERTGQRDE